MWIPSITGYHLKQLMQFSSPSFLLSFHELLDLLCFIRFFILIFSYLLTVHRFLYMVCNLLAGGQLHVLVIWCAEHNHFVYLVILEVSHISPIASDLAGVGLYTISFSVIMSKSQLAAHWLSQLDELCTRLARVTRERRYDIDCTGTY